MSEEGISAAQAAYEAAMRTIASQTGLNIDADALQPMIAWDEQPESLHAAWDAAADAAIARATISVMTERDNLRNVRDRLTAQLRQAKAERDKLARGGRILGQVVESQSLALYAAWIDHERGDHDAAKETVTQQIEQVLELHTWNGTETGTEWLERTREMDESAPEPQS